MFPKIVIKLKNFDLNETKNNFVGDTLNKVRII